MNPSDKTGRRRVAFEPPPPPAMGPQHVVKLIIKLIRRAIQHFNPPEEKTPQQEVREFLESLRAASDEELSGVLAVAIQAKKTLDTTRIIDTPFPADILDGHVPLDDAAQRRLTRYLSEMRRFQQMCVAQGTNLTASVAKGLDTWIVTFLTLTLPAAVEGREIWRLICRGEANVASAYQFLVRRELTEVERQYLSYRPLILTTP